jgi:predicted nucleotidyltransferase
MKPSDILEAHRDTIRRVVAAHRARNPRVFGSGLRGTDTEDSDLDLLVEPTADMTLLDIGAIRHDLLTETGLSVDVLTPNALPARIRAAVLAEARPV